MSYCTTEQVWKNLGRDAFTKVRAEAVGTGNGATSTWELDHDNVIDGTYTIYTGGNAVGTSSYSIDLDDGTITGLTAGSSVAVTADYNYADVEDSLVKQLISSSDNLLESSTGRTYGNSTGEVEYISVESKQSTFFTRHYPIISITSIEQNTSISVTDTPSWSTSAEGLGNDYLANDRDLEIGRFRFIDNFPTKGEDRLKVTYDYGYTSTPAIVQELSILMATRSMVNSAIYKAIFKGQDNFTPVRLEEIENRINELIRILRKPNFGLV